MFVPYELSWCLPCLSVCHSVRAKVPNIWLLNERENIQCREAGIKQSSHIELWTVHFVKPTTVFLN